MTSPRPPAPGRALTRASALDRAAAPVVEALECRRLLSGHAPGDTITLAPVADAYVRGGQHEETNYGAEEEVASKESRHARYDRLAYVTFVVPAGLEACAVDRVTLRLHGTLDSQESSVPYRVRGAEAEWYESSLTYASRPLDTTGDLDTQTLSGSESAWYEWDATEYVRGRVAAGDGEISLSVGSGQTATAIAAFSSREAAADQPELVIGVGDCDDDQPPEPTNYVPSTPLDVYGPHSYLTADRWMAPPGGGGNPRGPWGDFPKPRLPNPPRLPDPQPRPPTPVRPWRPLPGSGTLLFASVDASSSGTGHDWGHSRSYTTDERYEHRSVNGRGWVVHEQPFVKEWPNDDPDLESVAIVSGSAGPRIFDKRPDGSFASRTGSLDALRHDPDADQYVYRDGAGNAAVFHDFTVDDHSFKAGSLQTFTDPGGGRTEVTGRLTADVGGHGGRRGSPTQVTRYDASGEAVEWYTYDYGITSIGCIRIAPDAFGQVQLDVDLLVSITVESLVDDVRTPTQEVEFEYFGFGHYAAKSIEGGRLNHLASVITRRFDGSQWSTSSTYYRYHPFGSATTDALAAVVTDEGADRMVEDGRDPATADLTDLRPYASDFYNYDPQTGEVIYHESNGPGGEGVVHYQHERPMFRTHADDDDHRNSWAKRTTKNYGHFVSQEREITYVNYYGQPMLEVVVDGETGTEWRTFYRYAEDGSLLFRAEPSAVTDYAPNDPSLVGLDAAGTYDLILDDAGVVHHYEGYESTTATPAVDGGVAGRLKRHSISQGELGGLIPVSDHTWFVGAGGTGLGFAGDTTLYPDATPDNAGRGITISRQYEWFDGSDQPRAVLARLPAVSAAQNGSGLRDARRHVFDRDGEVRWAQDELGVLAYVERDPATDAVVKTVLDADTSLASAGEFAGYSPGDLGDLRLRTPDGAGTHLVSTADVDARGRPTAVVSADGVTSYLVWHDNGKAERPRNPWDPEEVHVQESVRVYPAWQEAVGGQPAGPAGASLYLLRSFEGQYDPDDGRWGYIESGSYTDAPSLDGAGRPTGTEAIGEFASLSRVHADRAGRTTGVDSYYDLATGLPNDLGIGAPGDGLPATLGAQDVNFHREAYGYDTRGRLERVVDWSGTTYRTVRDALGRPVSEHVGVDGAGEVQVADYGWDFGGTGDSSLTRVKLRVEGDDRVTRVFPDWRGRPALALVGVEEDPDGDGAGNVVSAVGGSYATRDNLGRTTATEYFALGGADLTGLAAAGFDADANGFPDRPGTENRRSRTEYDTDDRGRVFGVEQSFFDRTGGPVAGSLASWAAYDARGRTVKSWGSGSDLATKVAYDPLGRPISVFASDASDDAGYAAADDVAGDVVYAQADYLYDDGAGGRLAQVTRWQRHHDADASGDGRLGDTLSAGTGGGGGLPLGVPVSALPFLSATNGSGPVERDRSNGGPAAGDGGPITLDGVRYASGLGVHAGSEIEVDLAGRYARFTADVGVDDSRVDAGGNRRGSAVFRVYGDGTLLFESGVKRGGDAPDRVDVDVTGVSVLRLVADDAGESGPYHDHADWAGASLALAPGGAAAARPDHSAFYYDAAGRPSDTAYFGTAGGGAFDRPGTVPGRGTDFAYDALVGSVGYGPDGRVESATDPRGNVDRYRHDLLGRSVEVVESHDASDPAPRGDANRTTRYEHGPAGVTLITAVVPGGPDQKTRYVYGTETAAGHGVSTGHLLSAVYYPAPDTGAASPAHADSWLVNRLGEPLEATDRNGTTHAYAYDRLGRLVGDEAVVLGVLGEDADGNAIGVDGSVVRLGFGYDDAGFGSLASATSYDAAGGVANQVLREYDDAGRLLGEYQAHDGAADPATTPRVGYRHSPLTDGASRLTGLVYPDGREVGYEHDALGRLTAIVDGPTGAAAPTLEGYAYLGLGSLVERDRPEPGHRWTLVGDASDGSDSGDPYGGLDRFGRVVDHRWTTDGGVDLERHAYGYDPNGNRLWEDDLLAPGRGELYHDGSGYDALDRMTSFSRGTLVDTDGDGAFDAASGVTESRDWQLDALGNWEAVGGESSPREHDAQNRLTRVEGETLAHSRNGEMTRDEGGQSLAYDAWGRLVRVTDAAGAVVGDYAYDALQRRAVQDGVNLLYAGWQAVEERDADAGTVLAQNVWSAAYVDAMVLRDADTDGDGAVTDAGGSRRLYALHDANFDVTAVTDAGGNVVERYAYDPYGERTVLDASWQPTVGNQSGVGFVHGHQGLRLDEAAGLYDNRWRMYDPKLGRFTSQDPMGYIDGMSRYAAYGGSPATAVDPAGLQSMLAPPPGSLPPVDPTYGPATPDMVGSGTTVYIGDEQQQGPDDELRGGGIFVPEGLRTGGLSLPEAEAQLDWFLRILRQFTDPSYQRKHGVPRIQGMSSFAIMGIARANIDALEDRIGWLTKGNGQVIELLSGGGYRYGYWNKGPSVGARGSHPPGLQRQVLQIRKSLAAKLLDAAGAAVAGTPTPGAGPLDTPPDVDWDPQVLGPRHNGLDNGKSVGESGLAAMHSLSAGLAMLEVVIWTHGDDQGFFFRLPNGGRYLFQHEAEFFLRNWLKINPENILP